MTSNAMKAVLLMALAAFVLAAPLKAQNTTGFSFTSGNSSWEESFNDYRGTENSLPDFLFVTWDEDRTDNPFNGVGNFNTSDPDDFYGGFSAYTADQTDFSFGIRERAPMDLRDARLFFVFTNDTDEPISTFEISYDVEAWFIGDRRNRIRLKYDNVLDSDERDTFEVDIFSTVNPSSVTTPGTKVNGSLPEHRETVSDIIDITMIDDGTGNNFEALQPGETGYFRWQFSNASGDGGNLRSGLAINNVQISISSEDPGEPDQEAFSFTEDVTTYTQDFNNYRGSQETLPSVFFVDWDQTRIADPFGGVGDFNTADPTQEYGNMAAYTSDNENFSFGIRERAPDDLRDARLFFAFTNNTPVPISEFQVSYDVEAWYIGDRRNRLRLKYDTEIDSEERSTFEDDIFSTDNPSSANTPDTMVDGSLESNRTTVSGTIDITTLTKNPETGETFEPLAPGETAYFRWQFSNTDGDEGSLRSGLAINNLSITVLNATSTETEPGIPNSITLNQNYPNPFNPTTNISFQLPESQHVRLEVYNLAGQRVSTLINENRHAGTHTVSFDAASLASGVYIYRLSAGNEVQTRKMVLIK